MLLCADSWVSCWSVILQFGVVAKRVVVWFLSALLDWKWWIYDFGGVTWGKLLSSIPVRIAEIGLCLHFVYVFRKSINKKLRIL